MSVVSLTAAALGTAVLGCVVVGALGQLAGARAEADTAADLAALAAAGRVVRGEPASAACALATSVAASPTATVTGCSLDGEVVTVRVRRDLALLGVSLAVVGVARAGPVTGPAP